MPKEDEMQRTLVAEFPGAYIQYDKGSAIWLLDGPYSGSWELLSTTNSGCLAVSQQDIDLSGYALERKTFYPYSSFEQRSGLTSAKFDAVLTAQPYVAEATIITSVPLNTNDLGAAITYAPGFIYPGGFTNQQGRFNRDVIIHGEVKYYTVDSTLSVAGGNNTLKLIEREIYSSLEPTAADKLYCYKLILVSSAKDEGETATFPATRVLLPGNIASEPKLEYMMRLKRSYELANQV
jgi:hypothetical protein